MTTITVWKDTKKRCNPHARYTSADGTRYTKAPAELYEDAIAADQPADFSYDTYEVQETSDAPYVVYTPKSPKQLKQLRNQKRKERIARIEDKQSLRAIREALLTGDKTKLQEVEDQVIAVRGELEVDEEDA